MTYKINRSPIFYNYMEETVSYRRIRQAKPRSIQSTSQTLLRSPSHKANTTTTGIMGKNVSLYKHMIKDPHSKENYVDWAINLREHKKIEPKQKEGDNVPSVYYKETEIVKLRHTMKENMNLNTAQFSQFFSKNGAYASRDSINFIGQLHQSEFTRKQKTQKFNNIPRKDKNQLPKLLTKHAIKKMRNLNENDFEPSLDGDHRYPSYNYSILKEKNSMVLTTLAPCSKKVNLPNLAWQVGLRSY